MSFHEIRFPTDISLGASGGPERRTEIVTLGSGFEERNTPWAQSRRRYNAGYGVRSLNDIHAVIAFFEARQGRLYGFRWKDATDFKSTAPLAQTSPTDMVLGTGDGARTVFQLLKRYASGSQVYERRIDKPVASSVTVALAGVPLAPGAGWSLDPTNGRITFTTPPPTGAAVTAGFEFDVPVRFDTDRLDIDLTAFRAGEIPAIPLVELRLP